MAEILKLRSSTALDMFLKQRRTLGERYGRVTYCRYTSNNVLVSCSNLPLTYGVIVNELLVYWTKEIFKNMSTYSALSLIYKLPSRRSTGTLSIKATGEFWNKLQGVVIDLNVYQAVPSAFEVTLKEFGEDVMNTISSIVPSFSIPPWILYASAGVGILWLLKVKR